MVLSVAPLPPDARADDGGFYDAVAERRLNKAQDARGSQLRASNAMPFALSLSGLQTDSRPGGSDRYRTSPNAR